MEFEIKELKIVEKENLEKIVMLYIWEQSPSDEDSVQMLLDMGNKKITKIEDDYFTALCEIRREIEIDGIRLFCYGASRNVYPSPMLQNMGSGDKAYKLTLGKQATFDDLVSIFDSNKQVKGVTVEEQREFYDSWLNSLM